MHTHSICTEANITSKLATVRQSNKMKAPVARTSPASAQENAAGSPISQGSCMEIFPLYIVFELGAHKGA